MTINKNQEGSALVVELQGRLDTNTAPELEQVLNESLGGITELEIDFSELDYISSAGLRVLLTTHKTMVGKDGSMKVTGANEVVREIFDVTGFADILTIE